MHALSICLALATSAPALPSPPEVQPADLQAAQLDPFSGGGEETEGPLFGVSFDSGIPSGLAAGLSLGPLDFLRLSGAVTYNLAGFGFRAGADLVPFHSTVRPVLALRVGHAFDGDATRLAGLLKIPAADAEILRHVSYDYASAQLGVEIGSMHGFSAFAHVGLAYVTSSAPGFASLVRSANPGVTVTASDPRIHVTLPAVNIGVIRYFQ